MKRSQINAAIAHAMQLMKDNNITLPFFGYMTKADWEKSDIDYSVLKAVMMGWDVTDFSSDDFDHIGSTLFTVRNGSPYDKNVGVPYAEKYIIMQAKCNQEIPMHFHNIKSEDIINRAGGMLNIQVYNSRPDGSLDTESGVKLYQDGVLTVLKPGEVIHVQHGNSVTLTPGIYHRFFATEGDVIVGEVSSINDDNLDNVFLKPTGRFSEIEEDEPITYLQVKEYDFIKR